VPELPDITIYVESLRRHVQGRELRGIRTRSASLLRSVAPPPETAIGRRVVSVARLGKRIVLGFEEELFWGFHLMVAGRLRWRPPDAVGRPSGRCMLSGPVPSSPPACAPG